MGVSCKRARVQIDEGLFLKIAEGDEKAFEELYYITYKPLYAFVLSMTMSREDAEDLLQETYIKVRGACHLYQKKGNPMAWIMKIAKNLFLMKCRREKGKEVVTIENYEAQLSFNQIPAMEDRILLEQLFKTVTREDRDIIIMHVIMGMKHREIAEILEQPLGTVLSRYHRAMKVLKQRAKGQEERGA